MALSLGMRHVIKSLPLVEFNGPEVLGNVKRSPLLYGLVIKILRVLGLGEEKPAL